METLAPERNGIDPVRCFYDAPVTAEGVYQYYVAPYDDATSTEGPASGVVSVDIGDGRGEPRAGRGAYRVSPSFAGAPAVITLDASGSYDLDGTYRGVPLGLRCRRRCGLGKHGGSAGNE